MKFFVDTATLPPYAQCQTIKHVLPDNGPKAFLDDWAETGPSIL
jgi:hypothetical protein